LNTSAGCPIEAKQAAAQDAASNKVTACIKKLQEMVATQAVERAAKADERWVAIMEKQ
jgi:hypothetical protein